MKTRRIAAFVGATILLSGVAAIDAQNRWEGTAIVARSGEFPPGGLYAASNTFPLNSLIDVTNRANGRSARLIVAQRVDEPGVFLLLSEAAASELGVERSQSATMIATPVQLPGLTSIDPNQDLPFHPDPDVNPAARLGDPNQSIIRPPESARTDAREPEREATFPEVTRVEPEPQSEPTRQTEPTPAAEPEPELETEPEPAPEVAVVPEPAREPEPQPRVAPQPEPEPDTKPEPAVESAPKPQPESEPQTEPKLAGEAPDAPGTDAPPVDRLAERTESVISVPEEPDPGLEPEETPERPGEPPLEPSLEEPRVVIRPRVEVPAQERAPEPEPPVPIAEELEAEQAAEVADASLPYRTPVAREPLTVLLAMPGDPDESPEVAADAIPESDSEPDAPVELPTPVPGAPEREIGDDPLQQRLAEIRGELDQRVVSPAAVAETTPELIAPPRSDASIAINGRLPEPRLAADADAGITGVDPPVAGDSDVALREASERDRPEVSPPAPTAPAIALDSLELPLARIESEVDETIEPGAAPGDRLAAGPLPGPRDPDARPVERPTGDGAAEAPIPGPSLIPEDAEISLEPAEPRVPEAPAPEVDDLAPGEEPQAPDADVALGEPSAPGEVVVERPVDEVVTPTVDDGPPSDVALRQPDAEAGPTAPPARDVVAALDDEAWARANLPLVDRLERDASYVQVAAFTNPRSAKSTLDRLGTTFPVAVLPQPRDDRNVYRVFVGPLNEDEKGTALFTVRNRGFRDAFVRGE